MNVNEGTDRVIIAVFDGEFTQLHLRTRALIEATADAALYQNLRPCGAPTLSVGESVLRCAATVEQTFGGITANLWDDPFEWTLPENLTTAKRVIVYLDEVETTRRRAFASFVFDSDLLKEIMVPAGVTRPLISVLTETLIRASEFHGGALAASRLLSDR